ncbi:hypothetical protein TIFTF001_036354 [Ficus carica]|uniref:Uncharacterized protein n=1 Tax=Ficus carica TaxID=3494 RepID=A0AA88JAM3_FICCA|nr:hypothetical protein TIFTF001_036354 [Ficus carica]
MLNENLGHYKYFKLNRSSNRDNEVLSMRREIEEIKALVHGLCANKDVAPTFDQENVPTVDQHNSFKASCSVKEKQHEVSDLPTMPVDSQECKLYIFDEVHGGQLLVAFGRAWLESLSSDTVHGIPLGEGSVYLEELCRIKGQTEKFVLVSPTLISPVRIDTEDAGLRERADILISFLHDAPKG